MTRTTPLALLLCSALLLPARAQVVFPPVVTPGNGVFIDPDGKLSQRQIDDKNELAVQRLRAKTLNQPPKSNALTYVSLARLEGNGFGVCTNARAAGCEPRNCSTGFGEGASGVLAATALRNSRNSFPSWVGNPSVEWLTMSVWTCSARLNRIARPRGLASGALSGNAGSPVELEKRAVTGVDVLAT